MQPAEHLGACGHLARGPRWRHGQRHFANAASEITVQYMVVLAINGHLGLELISVERVLDCYMDGVQVL